MTRAEPAVRRALEAAALAIDPDTTMPPIHIERDMTGAPLDMAAAAIAAFLRALPGFLDYHEQTAIPNGVRAWSANGHGLAAAAAHRGEGVMGEHDKGHRPFVAIVHAAFPGQTDTQIGNRIALLVGARPETARNWVRGKAEPSAMVLLQLIERSDAFAAALSVHLTAIRKRRDA